MEQQVLAQNNQLRNKQQEVSNKEQEIERLKKEKSQSEISLNKKITELKKELESQLESVKNDRETKIEELKAMKEEKERIKIELEVIKNQQKEREEQEKNSFNVNTSYVIEEWIQRWKQSSNGNTEPIFLTPEMDKLFSYLEKHSENYKGRYAFKDLSHIYSNLLTKGLLESLKPINQQIEELEKKIEDLKRVRDFPETTKNPRTINSWFKEGLIIQQQIDLLHEMAQKGMINIDFDNTLYTWQQVVEMLK